MFFLFFFSYIYEGRVLVRSHSKDLKQNIYKSWQQVRKSGLFVHISCLTTQRTVFSTTENLLAARVEDFMWCRRSGSFCCTVQLLTFIIYWARRKMLRITLTDFHIFNVMYQFLKVNLIGAADKLNLCLI